MKQIILDFFQEDLFIYRPLLAPGCNLTIQDLEQRLSFEGLVRINLLLDYQQETASQLEEDDDWT